VQFPIAISFVAIFYGSFGFHINYPLVNEHNYGKSPFIVDFPMKNGDFHSYVSLPEGKLFSIKRLEA